MQTHPQPPSPQPLLDGSKPSNNGGRVQKNFAPDRLRSGSEANSEQRGSVANASQPIPAEWVARHAEGIEKAIHKAQKQGVELKRPWQLMADRQTKNILADCPDRSQVSDETAQRYRREFARLVADGTTAYEEANSAQHWNLLRTASRFCLEAEIRRLRAESEQARRKKNIPLAQEKTIEAFRLAIALDEQFLAYGHKTWADKRNQMKAEGLKPANRSKRDTKTPRTELVGVLLADSRHRGHKVANRHAEALAVLALTGCRPSELKRGVEVVLTPGGLIAFKIAGAKCNETRGQDTRYMGMKVTCPLTRGMSQACKEAGGRKVITMTDADQRSLNRALRLHGLSCYSFRHAFGSQMKNNIATGAMKPEQVAKAMGHASTKSVTYYGRTTRHRTTRAVEVNATREVKPSAVTLRDKASRRRERKNAEAFRFPERPEGVPSASYASGPKWKIPQGPKPPNAMH